MPILTALILSIPKDHSCQFLSLSHLYFITIDKSILFINVFNDIVALKVISIQSPYFAKFRPSYCFTLKNLFIGLKAR
jgi:hypothetical protein